MTALSLNGFELCKDKAFLP